MSEENNEFGFGCLPGKIDLRDYKIKREVAMAYNYPETFSLDHPPVKNQGAVGSCVAHATSEILESHLKEYKKLSTNFLYGIHYKLFGSKGPGMYLREACKIAKDYGDPEEIFCKGNTEVPHVYSMAENSFNDPDVLENANKYKINSYVKLRTENDIKYSLMYHGPVLISVEWFSDYEFKYSTGILSPGVKSAGLHCIMIYGWNEDGWLCQNSWGELWGKNGCFVLPYTYEINEAYALISDPSRDDINKVKRCKFLDFMYKILNNLINWFVDVFRWLKK